MADIIGTTDDDMMRVRDALTAYETTYPGSSATTRRINPASIRIRIIDDRFQGMSKSRRHDDVCDFLFPLLGDELVQDLTVLLLLPTSELGRSLANLDFEEPLSSRL